MNHKYRPSYDVVDDSDVFTISGSVVMDGWKPHFKPFKRSFGSRMYTRFVEPVIDTQKYLAAKKAMLCGEAKGRIVSAAVKLGDTVYALPKPARHADILDIMRDVHDVANPMKGTRGFLTSYGKFVDRYLGKLIADREGQQHPGGFPRLTGKQLFSSDLW